ncbi:MAG TPA: hypothetical protein VI796_05205 [Candidatus Thermoplasmatota archaeon]|nr:hypothetical protein [Candidatus Thermoplasmatota archaeon]
MARIRDGKPEPLSLVLAHAGVEGEIDLALKAPTKVKVAKGQRLDLKLTYRLQEASRDKEEYRFTLVTRLGEERAEPATAHWGDTWGYPEDVQGYVVNPYTPRRAGTFDLVWQATAEYGVRAWSEGEGAANVQRRSLRGLVQVTVSDA